MFLGTLAGTGVRVYTGRTRGSRLHWPDPRSRLHWPDPGFASTLAGLAFASTLAGPAFASTLAGPGVLVYTRRNLFFLSLSFLLTCGE